jgi:glycosyltransferase involved in cell wall biosynthesis
MAEVLEKAAAGSVVDPCFEPIARLPGAGRRNRTRIVHVLATAGTGGAQEHVFNLATRLDPDRYEVSVCALAPGVAVRRLERAGVPACVMDIADDDAAIEALAAHLAAVRADVVHAHMYRAEVVATRAAWLLASRGRTRPVVVATVHSSRVRPDEDRELLRRLTPRMDHLIAVSRAIVAKIEHEGRVGAPVSLIYNGVDLARYAGAVASPTLRDEHRISADAPLVGVVARLEPEKGHPTLLDAWPRVLRDVPDGVLLVIGEGSRRPALEAQAHELGLLGAKRGAGRRVAFTGARDDVPALTAALDVAVLPSYREAQGLSILEAMALGRPVVASGVGGIPEMIEDGRTGLLVPPHDPGALAEAIVRVLQDAHLRQALGRAGHDLVAERFCLEQMVRSVEAIYDDAVGGEGELAG